MEAKELAKLIKEDVEWLKDGQLGCCTHKLNDKLAVCVGWSAGFGKEDRDDAIQARNDKDFAICAKIAVWPSDTMRTDLDFINMPYTEDGEVIDTNISINPKEAKSAESLKEIARYLLKEYNGMKDLKITDDGLIIKEEEIDLKEPEEEVKEKEEIKVEEKPLEEAKFGFKPLTKNNVKNMSITELLDNLAFKAARYWVSLSPEFQDWYDSQGTSMVFEKWDEAYSRILKLTTEECKELGVEDHYDAFDLLDEKMWDYVTKLENGEMHEKLDEPIEEACKLKEEDKLMYIVITNGEEVKGEVEGIFDTHEDAVEKFEEIKKDWQTWAEGAECDEEEYEDYYSLTNYDEDEFMEVKIVKKNIGSKGLKKQNESLEKKDVYIAADSLDTDNKFYLFMNDIVSSEDDKGWKDVEEEEKQILLTAREFHNDFFKECGNKEFKTYKEFLRALKKVYKNGNYPLLESLKEDKETQKKAAFENACDCLKFGYGKDKCNFAGLSSEEAEEVWKKAFEYMSKDESANKKLDDIDAKADNKKELAKKKFMKAKDDADADRDYNKKAAKLKVKESADLTKVEGTYSKLLQDNIKDIYACYGDYACDINKLKELVKKIVEPASDTDAKRGFLLNVDKQKDKLNLAELCTNAILRASKDTRLPNDKWANERKGKQLKESVYGEDIIEDISEIACSSVIHGDDIDEAIKDAIDSKLIYNEDIIAVAKYYDALNMAELIDRFYEELYADVYKYIEKYLANLDECYFNEDEMDYKEEL